MDSNRRPNPADERIKNLLLTTDLTFKQIIDQLKNEGLAASFNTIRRVNRNNRYRKPRYDAKLTTNQRKQLISQLRTEIKPNLSSLARQYGVCHGSIWYWWDKLSRMREKNNGVIPDGYLQDDDEDMSSGEPDQKTDLAGIMIGLVKAKSRDGNYIDLPISMFSCANESFEMKQ